MNLNEGDKILIGMLAIAFAIYVGLSEAPQQITEYEACYEKVTDATNNWKSAALKCAPGN